VSSATAWYTARPLPGWSPCLLREPGFSGQSRRPVQGGSTTGLLAGIWRPLRARAPPPFFPLVLFADRSATVISGVNGSWSVRKPNHTVEIDSSAPAPPLICGADGLPPGCDFFDRSIGPKTPEGIASQAAPGHVDAYLGVGIAERFVLSAPFWAVRTGPVHHHT
jgi:hypothetical protein